MAVWTVIRAVRSITLVVLTLLLAQPACLRNRGHADRVQAPPPPPAPVSLPAGATLALRTAQAIDSTVFQPGQTFAAVVSRDITDREGRTIVPSGCPITLVLLKGKDEGTFELGAASLMLNGDAYLVRDGGASPAARGALLGTYLGGVPGVARPGGLTQLPLVVSPRRISVPPGSLLTFRLDAPLTLAGALR